MFYTVRQNNSGGAFIQNEFVDEYLCVEANSIEHAKERISEITEDHSDYCPCCGERWSYWFDEDDAKEFPHDGYGDKFEDGKTFIYSKNGGAVIHYLDGRVEKIELNRFMG